MQESPKITAQSWFLVAALGLIWGSTFMVIELALTGITPFWLAAARISFAAVLTTAIWGIRGSKLFIGDSKNWGMLVWIGVLSTTLPFILLSWGQQFVTSAYAGVSMASVPLFLLPLAHFFLVGEQLTIRRAVGFGLGFLGVIVLVGPQAFSSSGNILEPIGKAACLGAALCYALSSLFTRKLPAIDPIGLAAVPLLIGTIVIIPIAWIVEGPPPVVANETLVYLAVLGLIPTAGANFLRVIVIRTAGPVFMTLCNYQVPLWSVIMGIVILGEDAKPTLYMAMGFILCGLFISQWGALTRLFLQKRKS